VEGPDVETSDRRSYSAPFGDIGRSGLFAVIDALSIRIPASTAWTHQGWDVYLRATQRQMLTPQPHYKMAGDLRPLGYPVRLSLDSWPGMKTDDHRVSTHKVEIYDTAEKTESEMLNLVMTLFEIRSASELDVTRLDLCTDVLGTSVPWFVRHTLVQYKRLQREILIMRVKDRAESETWYAGKKPNQIRIYNKTAERQKQLSYENKKRVEKGEPRQGFEERFGYDPTLTVTRVERQYGGQVVKQFGELKGLTKEEPFERMTITPNGVPDMSPSNSGDLTWWLAGTKLREMVVEDGLQSVAALIRKNVDRRNFKRTWERFEPWLSVEDSEPAVTVDQLNRNFQKTVASQLGTEYDS
jgi:hypothetical protein